MRLEARHWVAGGAILLGVVLLAFLLAPGKAVRQGGAGTSPRTALPTAAQAVALAERAAAENAAPAKLALAKEALNAFKAIAEANPTSDLAMRLHSGEPLGSVNFAAMRETVCLLEPGTQCLAHLAWDRRPLLGTVKSAEDPAGRIAEAMVWAGQPGLARQLASSIQGLDKAEVRRDAFARIASAEAIRYGREKAAAAAMGLPDESDRKAAMAALPPAQDDAGAAALAVEARRTLEALAARPQHYDAIGPVFRAVDAQVKAGRTKDALATLEALQAQALQWPRFGSKLAILRNIALARQDLGDAAGAGESLALLCELAPQVALSNDHWERRDAPAAMANCGVALATIRGVGAALELARTLAAADQSPVIKAIVQQHVLHDRWAEAAAAARSLAGSAKDEAYEYIAVHAARKDRAGALQIAEGIQERGPLLRTYIQIAALDLERKDPARAREALGEAARYVDAGWIWEADVAALAYLYSVAGDAGGARDQLAGLTERNRKDGSGSHHYAVATHALLGDFEGARNVVGLAKGHGQYIELVTAYLRGMDGCVRTGYAGFEGFGRTCPGGKVYSRESRFVPRALAWHW